MTSYLLPYTDGTVSVNNTATVTGSLTAWLHEVKPGDRMRIGTTERTVASVETNTSLTLAEAWPTSASGQSYAIDRWSRGWFSGGDLALALALYNTNRPTFIPTTGQPSNSVGADGNIAVDAIAGMFYSKSSGTWDSGTSFVGPTGATGDTGATGATGATGDTGDDGWSPVLAVATDTERRVLQINDWTGGAGTKPATGDYIGPAGLVSVIGSAVDIRGPAGADGSGSVSSVNGEIGDVVLDATEIDISALTPANYTPADASTEGHLGGIDTALGTLDGDIETVASSVAALVTGVSSVNGEAGAVTLTADDVDVSALTPSNYTPADASTEGHLGGIDDALGALQSSISSVTGVPAGAVQNFAMSTPPTGWLKANGALVSRTTYENLFAAIGTTFGAGDGSTTFALPDLRGEFIRGWDDARGVDTGRVFGSAQAQAVQKLPLDCSTSGFNMIVGDGGGPPLNVQTGPYLKYSALSTFSVGSGTETRPRNVAFLVCIKY